MRSKYKKRTGNLYFMFSRKCKTDNLNNKKATI